MKHLQWLIETFLRCPLTGDRQRIVATRGHEAGLKCLEFTTVGPRSAGTQRTAWRHRIYSVEMDPAEEFKESVQRPRPKTGAELITLERARQMSAEGWTAAHDDKHASAELTKAAISYAYTLAYPDEWASEHEQLPAPSDDWPWAKKWWKPSKDPVRNLVKAGALLAAEIDRLQRKAAR